MTGSPQFARLDGERTSVVWMARGDALELLHLGPRLHDAEDLAVLAAAAARGRHENQPDVPPTGGLLPDPRSGWRGPLLAEFSRDGLPVTPRWTGLHIETSPDLGTIAANWSDGDLETHLRISWTMGAGDVIVTHTQFTDTGFRAIGERGVVTTRCASLLLPLPRGFDKVTHFAGRWADDMRAERLPVSRASLGWASRGGKPGFAGGDWLVFDDEETGAQLGFHIAATGDHEVRIERNDDGNASLVAETPIPAPGFGGLHTPEALIGWAPDAATLTRAFHAHARERLASYAHNAPRERRVHFNTWEACAFDFDEARLMRLAEDAAALGAERFALDDGWFKGRSSDRAGLGDWVPDPVRFPNGLGPLIAYVKALGMDFGLWVEPEMVSPDSDLYRAHPDWCLHEPGLPRPTERNQLVLDFTRPEVGDHIHACIAKLLRENDIAYLKWDHNRRLFPQPPLGAHPGRLRMMWDQLRADFPHTMIESCSSGGGRIDMGLLGPIERFWPSDNNDTIERIRIMREWSRLLPLEVLGSHVGPSPNPITGRRLAMDFRAKVAVFGHMGVEADPARMTDKERECLAAHIALYKQWRGVLHAGDLHHLAHPDPNIMGMMVTHGDKALALVAQTAFSPVFDAAPVRLAGLEPEALYRVTLPAPWPPRARHYLANPDAWREGLILSGAALMGHGLALPLTHPETAWLIALEKIA
ncbi:MAG: alpha-galactosidase [Porphyrobacter sp.]|nr:alpha-galactosidase [Porphyrobacter sp.]